MSLGATNLKGDHYQPHIDGLRAIAITSVVAYHAGLPATPGGFVGVDVFFVISGFLITRLLFSELSASGTIDLVNFYARRARRLLPAFMIVVGVTLLLGFFILVPVDFEQSRLARSAANASIYISNIHFARRGGYFEAPIENSPLLHTWSLAVEEQFYLVWPLLLLLIAALSRRFTWPLRRMVIAALGLILVISLGYSYIATHLAAESQRASFFLITSRAWELAVGALTGMLVADGTVRSRLAGEVLTAAGLAAIAAAILMYSGALPYPGVAATLPVAGSAAVLAGGFLAPGALGVRLLQSRPFVAIGLVSYGWYLWHWPLLVMARVHALGERDLNRDLAIAVFSLLLAWLTYRYVENPIRRRQMWPDWTDKKLLLTAAAATACLNLLALSLAGWEKAQQKWNSEAAMLDKAAHDKNPRHTKCQGLKKGGNLEPRGNCTVPAEVGAPQVVVWGDSHADHIVPLVEAAADASGAGVLQRTMNGCLPLPRDVLVSRDGVIDADCSKFNGLVMDEIKAAVANGLKGIVMAGRWSLYQERKPISIRMQGRRYVLQSPSAPAAASLDVIEDSIRRLVSELTGLGLKVVVMAPMPEQRFHGPWCLARRAADSCSVPLPEEEAYRAGAVQAMTKAIAGLPNVRLIDPMPQLCPGGICAAELANVVIFRDTDHITTAAARGLAPWFSETAKWLAAVAAPSTADAHTP